MEPPVYVFIGQGGLGYSTLRTRARTVEDCGYDGLWLVDHFWARDRPDADFLDGWTTIAGLAEATERLRLGVLVTCNTFRNPGVLAKIAATADHISNGRIELGLGSELGLDLPGRMATVQGSDIETGSQDRRGLAELEAI